MITHPIERLHLRKQDYYWCNTAQGWDYCSPSENRDYKNKQCREDSPCGKQGEKYNWCWLKEGSWGYCGLVEPKMFLHRSKYHYVCIDECQYYESGDYYWCHTAKGWDYCSPVVDVTYKGKSCRSDDSCGSHDYSYNWCWTSESEYDYCGPIESGECTYIPSKHRNKRAPDKKIVICREKDETSGKEIIFTAEEAPEDIAKSKQLEKDLENVISCWKNNYLVGQARSKLANSGNLRHAFEYVALEYYICLTESILHICFSE
ncbi:uncharacterized protein LOC107737102 [Sinocyclocheilus rhinocerous]|uniref:Uncharacterized LOC107737102 n=1 Tax=Sinocyclocheilus rhinocerous TaxID=307959 RepID=A0A673FTH2_9TELE|nr:PREDICTED: uncharacterized protein LOC107737102 [Sinocyclocheilus rhinocerous]